MVSAVGPSPVWRRIMLRGAAVSNETDGPGFPPEGPPRALAKRQARTGTLVRRARPNVKRSPKTRDLDRAFAHHVEIIGDVDIRGGLTTEIRAKYGQRPEI